MIISRLEILVHLLIERVLAGVEDSMSIMARNTTKYIWTLTMVIISTYLGDKGISKTIQFASILNQQSNGIMIACKVD